MLVHAIDCDLNILYILSRHARIYLDIILHFMHANFIYGNVMLLSFKVFQSIKLFHLLLMNLSYHTAIEVTTGLVKKT